MPINHTQRRVAFLNSLLINLKGHLGARRLVWAVPLCILVGVSLLTGASLVSNGSLNVGAIYLTKAILSGHAPSSQHIGTAEQWLQRSVDLVPTQWRAIRLLGITRIWLGDFETGEHLLARLPVACPSAPFYTFGDLSKRNGDEERAMAAYHAAIRIDPNCAARGYISIAQILEARKEHRAAILYLRLALEQDPSMVLTAGVNPAEIHRRLGYALFNAGDYVEAESQFLEVLKIAPDGPTPITGSDYAGLARIYLERGFLNSFPRILNKPAG